MLRLSPNFFKVQEMKEQDNEVRVSATCPPIFIPLKVS